MRNSKTILFAGLLAFLAPITLLSQKAPAPPQSATAKLQVTQCALRVKGMDCDGCAVMVQKGLLKLDGVKTAQVDFKTGEARIEFDSRKTTPEKIVEAFNQIGSGIHVEKLKSGAK